MGPLDFLFHLFGFAAPALALGLLMPLASRLVLRQHRVARGYWLQAAVVAACGALALAGGLVFFGRDGKMASYAALVLAAASAQWVLAGGWRR